MAKSNLQDWAQQEFDVLIAGGGINGAGIAADAAGRGLKVGLCEAADFASGTSSASSKLIHGGIRYLEHMEFRLVSKSLAEREILLRNAPHIISPMRFRLPHRPFLRPIWMIRAGLLLYDHLSKRNHLPASHAIKFSSSSPLHPDITRGFEYSDCWVDDARLVILNLIAARDHGAFISNYCKVAHCEQNTDHWLVTLQDTTNNRSVKVRTRLLVNAAGPWVSQFYDEQLRQPCPHGLRLVKGSHIIVPKIHCDEHAYVLQTQDKRIVFVIPYLEHFSLIGTTDMDYQGDLNTPSISQQEIQYLIEIVQEYFIKEISPDDIISSYAGVRPLWDDSSQAPHKLSRDYRLELQQTPTKAPLLSVFGGKLTTYRTLAETAMRLIQPLFPNIAGPWTAKQPLPGGDFHYSPSQFSANLCHVFPWLLHATAHRYVAQYGTLLWLMLADVCNEKDMGKVIAPGVYEKEIQYLMNYEWAKTPEDILWRRTKLGLLLSPEQQQNIIDYMSGTMNQGPKIES